MAQRELKKEGIQCTALRVETKDDFLAALKEFRPDVIISDYSMPLFDGMRALKLSLEFDPLTPFILLTGSMNEEVAVNCMKAGATDYVIKEHISALPLVVKEALRQKQNRIEKEQVDESLRVRFAELEALHTLSSTLRTSQKLDQMLPLLLDQTLSVLETDSGAIWLYQAESADLRLAVARGWFSNIKGTAMVPGEGITGTVFLSGKAHLSVDFSEDPLVNHTKNPEVPAGWGGICVPIRTASEVVGVLFVSIQSPRQITPEQTRLLDSLAEMAGNTIHRMRLYEETIKRAEQLEAINLLGRALAETLDLPQMYAQVYKAANRLIPDTAAFFISLYHPDQQTITCEFGVVDKEEIDSRQLPIIPLAPAGKGLQSRVIHTAEALIVDDLMEKVDLTVSVIVGANKEKVTQTALYVPMLSRSKVVGVVQMQSYTPHRFKFADVSLLEMVANTAAAAIENARLLLETRQQVEHLQALHSINTSIAENMDLHVTLLKLLEHATQQLEVDAANILLLNPATHMLEFAAGRGFCTPRVQTARVRLGESMAGRAALEGRTIVADHVDAENSHFAELWSAEGFLFYSAAPLIVENQIKGVLEIYRRTPLHPDANWLAFLEMLAAQAAVALDNT
ncbi:MAG TPA: GAF domain-containing protein, partial [Anaerolineaceae bacterium]|nr:GAF domain-containing protein [Anaerolineaceae bacterium]